ncbi:MAG TPA: aminoacetone oxidase family FAD-binding enzyme [Clostridiales bacterium]|nr:aminoacetone oxidase family FAD-binding enzyme [Clostridiales bacterium]
MKILVIGAGPAGLMAAGTLAERGFDVTLADKNEKTGKKLYITGKGRCNVTNECDGKEFLANVVSNPKFLMSAINAFDSYNTVDFLQKNGLNTVTERGNRVFPASQKSSDVIKTFTDYCRKNGVKILLSAKVSGVKSDGEDFVVSFSDKTERFQKVIVATGGLSYPSTGSTGDGYEIAESFGHKIVKPVQALVPIELNEPWVQKLSGLSLKNVRCTVTAGEKEIASDFGEMLFTHKGVSGPIILSLSSKINRLNPNGLKLVIDLKPALSDDVLDARLQRDFAELNLKQFKNSLDGLLPKSLVPVIVGLSKINPEQKVGQITREQRKNLVHLLKNLTFFVKKLAGFEEAIVTAGGVDVKEINPKTMESKLQKGLYFVGEVLDVDALTGGFNIQIALSTAFAAATHILG